MIRLAPIFCLLTTCFCLPPQSVAAATPAFKAAIRPLLKRYCFRCHDETKSEADLRLDTLRSDFDDSATAETWHDVLNRINLGEMPPDGEQQPTASELQQIVDRLTIELKRAAQRKREDGGQVVLRRLTRYEYDNTLRDLLGIQFDFAGDLPPEPVSEDGFQNSGAALGMSPLQIELYLQIARVALGKAIVAGPEPEVFRHRVEKNEARRKKKQAAATNTLAPGAGFVARVMQFPREGEIVVRVQAGATIPDGKGFPRMKLTFGMRSDVLTAEETFGEVDVTASADSPKVYEFRRRIEQFPLPGHNPKFPGVMITVWNSNTAEPTLSKQELRKNKKKGESAAEKPVDASTLFVESVEFEGPVFESWPPESHTRIFLTRRSDEDDTSYARRLIKRFATRAYRRPATPTEVDLLTSFYDKTRDQWPTFEEAIGETLAMVLVSPAFLYLMEPNERAGTKQPLTEFELASRLSYFLWSSMPDDKLFGMAKNGELRDPLTLQRLVRDMIADPRSNQFVHHFAGQWLNLSGIDRVAVNPEYYPKFKDSLKAEMRRETLAFFGEILRNDLSALNFIDSDFAMLNRPLAAHYGINGPLGSDFERVALTPNDRRGGLLTQASVLLSNSTGEDSHPIRRAVWILDRMLDSPPSPPPPDVPELNQDEPQFAQLSVKEQLELHREKDSCNNCHKGIDPWGIAFENYDAVGKWRTEILHDAKNGRGKTSPVVAGSTLPDGHDIDGPDDLKRYLLEHDRDRFSRALVRKLLSYSLGRSLDLSDQETVDALNESFAESEYRLTDLIVAIVQSDPFQSK